MRFLLLFSTIFSTFFALGEGFTVFEENGKYGLQNEGGEIAIPAVYEKLGWSNGSAEVFENIIGFKKNNLWGLISIRNKVLAENKFHTLNPFDTGLLKASVKDGSDDHAFHGILDARGKVRISFDYSDLSIIGDFILALVFDQNQSKAGLIDRDNGIIIPIEYKSITVSDRLFLADRFDYRKDIFLNERLIASNLDSVHFKNGIVGFKNGKAGYINQNGLLEHEFTFKNFTVDNRKIKPVAFPLWEVHDLAAKILERNCDSLTRNSGSWTMHLNGAKHKVFESDFIVPNEYELREVANGRLVVQDKKTNLWSILGESGELLIEDKDLIEVNGNHFFVKKSNEWDLFNGFGKKVNKSSLEVLKNGVGAHFLVKGKNSWGVIDSLGNSIIRLKYDSIKVEAKEYYTTKFQGKWGIMDRRGNWSFYQDYDEFKSFGNLIVGRRGQSLSLFDGIQFRFQVTFQIEFSLGEFFAMTDKDGNYGVIDSVGSIVVPPQYKSIKRIDDFFVFEDSEFSILANLEGDIIVDSDENYDDFREIGEGFISAKKHGKWGFVDFIGRLRVANRYEHIAAYQEGHAGVHLKGKWGFINKYENLVVQPHYDEVSSFSNGLAIVREQDKYGLIDQKGKAIVAVEWLSIERSIYGNYLVKSEEGLSGLADKNGAFILRPNFESIIDYRQNIIVNKNGRAGVLDYEGHQLFKVRYSDVKRKGDFILLKK